MATHEERIRDLEIDMWIGKDSDNPPITTRLDRLEISMRVLRQLSWVIVAGIVAAIGDIINTHLTHIGK